MSVLKKLIAYGCRPLTFDLWTPFKGLKIIQQCIMLQCNSIKYNRLYFLKNVLFFNQKLTFLFFFFIVLKDCGDVLTITCPAFILCTL